MVPTGIGHLANFMKLSHSLLLLIMVCTIQEVAITPEINYLSIADPAVWFWLLTSGV